VHTYGGAENDGCVGGFEVTFVAHVLGATSVPPAAGVAVGLPSWAQTRVQRARAKARTRIAEMGVGRSWSCSKGHGHPAGLD
jgi:hypothetical protein